MKKRWWIILGSLAGIIVIFVILCFTLFSLKSVKVDFRTSTTVLTGQETEIIESGEFEYGHCVLFLGKKDNIAKLESANPYLKVVNIETTFPSGYIIHCAERQEVYSIKLNDNFYICDEEFKVLRVEKTQPEGLPEFSGLRVNNSNAVAGEFLSIENKIDVYNAFLENNRPLHEQKALFTAIETGVMENELNKSEQYISLKMQSGQTFVIKNAGYKLNFKIAKMLSVYSNIFSLIGEPIKGSEGEIWTAELLKTCRVEIRDLYATENPADYDFHVSIIPSINEE